jgi:hypothetical protein
MSRRFDLAAWLREFTGAGGKLWGRPDGGITLCVSFDRDANPLPSIMMAALHRRRQRMVVRAAYRLGLVS